MGDNYDELVKLDEKFGFIVVGGNETLFGTLSGNTPEVLHRFSVDVLKMHGRGGPSALRFARIRMEKRQNYLCKVSELATQYYINPSAGLLNVDGLILAGSGDFKPELVQTYRFDPRLAAKIMRVVSVAYGGEQGFKHAIELSFDILKNAKFIQEKCFDREVPYFLEISQDTGKFVFGLDATLYTLESGAVQTLIVWEDLNINRYVMKNSSTGEIVIRHLNQEEEGDVENFKQGQHRVGYGGDDVVAGVAG